MPDWTGDILAAEAIPLLLVLARTAAMLLVAPVFGHRAVPVRLRVAMGLVLGLGASASAPAAGAAVPVGLAAVAAALAAEATVGLLLGGLARLVFVGVELGAWHVAQQMGVNLARSYAPGAPAGGVAVLGALATVIFLAIGGHRELIAGLVLSLRAAPAGDLIDPAAALGSAVSLLGVAMVVALKVAAPVLAALLLTGIVLGLLQRTTPQFGLFSTNLPIRALVALAVLAGGLAVLPGVVEWAWDRALREIHFAAAGGAMP